MIKICEMAMGRGEAISFCLSLGKNFIRHFHKIYNNPNDKSIDHWIAEMNAWYNDVLEIKLKPKSKHLLNTQINDWFFTAGADSKDYMDKEHTSDDEIEIYDKFCFMLFAGNTIEESLRKLNLIK